MDGVVRTRVGFAGGHTPDANYHQVCTGTTGHAETVEVCFDPNILAPAAVLTEFFTLHDSGKDRSGKDGGGQYRSAIFVDPQDPGAQDLLAVAHKVRDHLTANGIESTTEIILIDAFYPAAARHQQYCSARGLSPPRREADRAGALLTEF